MMSEMISMVFQAVEWDLEFIHRTVWNIQNHDGIILIKMI